MQPLIIFYSLDGNTRLIAREIAAETGGELLELSPLKDYGKGFSRYMVGGMQALFGHRPPLQAFLPSPEEYQRLVIGTPVWAGRMSAPIRTFLTAQALSERDVALFCTHRGAPGRTLAGMAKMLRGNRITGQMSVLMRENNRESRKMARAWARDLYD